MIDETLVIRFVVKESLDVGDSRKNTSKNFHQSGWSSGMNIGFLEPDESPLKLSRFHHRRLIGENWSKGDRSVIM